MFASLFNEKISYYESIEIDVVIVVELSSVTSTPVEPESVASCSLTHFDVLSDFK